VTKFGVSTIFTSEVMECLIRAIRKAIRSFLQIRSHNYIKIMILIAITIVDWPPLSKRLELIFEAGRLTIFQAY